MKIGRPIGTRSSDKKAKKVLEMVEEGLSYRLIDRKLGMSKNTVMQITKRGSNAGGPIKTTLSAQAPNKDHRISN